MCDHSLSHEGADQLHGRRLQHRPAERVEAPVAELLVPEVEVGQTQGPHRGGEVLRCDGACELAEYEDRGRLPGARPPAEALQNPAGVAPGVAESEDVYDGHGVGDGEADRQLQAAGLPQQLELVAAAAELEGGRRLPQVNPGNPGEESRSPPDRLAEEHRDPQHRQGHPQVRHSSEGSTCSRCRAELLLTRVSLLLCPVDPGPERQAARRATGSKEGQPSQ